MLRNSRLHAEIIHQCVSLLTEYPGEDIGYVRNKVIRQNGCHKVRDLPTVEDIERALHNGTSLDNSAVILSDWRQQKRVIIESLRFFAQFKPRVGGALARGVWVSKATTELYLFADSVEQVQLLLMSSPIDWQQQDKMRKTTAGEFVRLAGFSFYADGYHFVAYVIARAGRLLDDVTGKQQKMLSRLAIEQMD